MSTGIKKLNFQLSKVKRFGLGPDKEPQFTTFTLGAHDLSDHLHNEGCGFVSWFIRTDVLNPKPTCETHRDELTTAYMEIKLSMTANMNAKFAMLEDFHKIDSDRDSIRLWKFIRGESLAPSANPRIHINHLCDLRRNLTIPATTGCVGFVGEFKRITNEITMIQNYLCPDFPQDPDEYVLWDIIMLIISKVPAFKTFWEGQTTTPSEQRTAAHILPLLPSLDYLFFQSTQPTLASKPIQPTQLVALSAPGTGAVPCKYFYGRNSCRKGSNCNFSHNVEVTQEQRLLFKQQTQRSYPRGQDGRNSHGGGHGGGNHRGGNNGPKDGGGHRGRNSGGHGNGGKRAKRSKEDSDDEDGEDKKGHQLGQASISRLMGQMETMAKSISELAKKKD
jgi:hypothetical protein